MDQEHDYYTGSEPGINETTQNLVLDGGLAICKVCGNGEGALSTHFHQRRVGSRPRIHRHSI